MNEVVKKKYSKKSIRMCVACRKRELQKDLFRFNVMESVLQLYNGKGRSFYLCCKCSREGTTYRSVKKFVKKAQNLKEQFEEIMQICQK